MISNFQIHTHHNVTNMHGVIFLRSLFSAIVISQHINPCDIFRSYVTFNFQVTQQATLEVEISAEIYNNLRKYIL